MQIYYCKSILRKYNIFSKKFQVSYVSMEKLKRAIKTVKSGTINSHFSTNSALVGALSSSKINLLPLKFTTLNNSLSVSYFDFFSLFNSLSSSISSANIALDGSVFYELSKFLAFLNNFSSFMSIYISFFVFISYFFGSHNSRFFGLDP